MLTNFSELAGQESTVARIKTALANDRVHHALLFCGPDGVGKYLAAQHLAQVFVCRQVNKAGEACGECPACYKCHHTSHPDIVELAPNEKNKISVDDIRQASQVLYIQPLEAPFKVLIIRDADTMNPQAQNALLKTLEEPPGNSKIILTSAKPRAFLLTILSRCQRLDFLPVPTEAIQKMLLSQLDLDEATAHLIAALSQGSPARALNTDPDETVAHRDRVADLDLALSASTPRCAAKAIQQASELSSEKDELKNRLQLLGVWLRDQILIASNSENVAIANIDRQKELRELAAERGLYQVLNRAKALELAQNKLAQPFNLNVGLVVEQLCLSLAGQNGSVS